MDKKNLTIGALLFLTAFAIMILGPHAPQSSPPAPSIGQIANPLASNPTGSSAPPAAPADAAFGALETDDTGEKITHLGNDFIDVAFTDHGGAIKDVAFLKYPAKQGRPGPYIFNALHVDPMLALVDFPGLGRDVRYTLVSHSAREVVFRAVLENRIEVTRRYTIEPDNTKTGDPYQLRHETVFRNLSGETVPLPTLAVSLGTAAPPAEVRDYGYYLKAGYSNGSSVDFISSARSEGGILSFFGLAPLVWKPIAPVSKFSPIVWASVKNQFFASILTPDEPGMGIDAGGIALPSSEVGVEGSVLFNVKPLAPHGEESLGMNFYVGPKEYKRLANADVFKHDQDKLMEFGFFKIFSQLLLEIMTWVHGWMPNWGFAIIFTTLSIKIIFLPFSFGMARSARRMQKIQPLLKDIREKYKDNPKKLNEAQLAIFKEHKVNPLAGCVPMLITFPFFIGFFSMLRGVPEFRFAPFVWWVHDLSAPDTVAYIAGFPIRILPIVMGVTMISQMFFVPQAANVDKAQLRMMRFMPLMYMAICYNYSCALSLYSTTNSLFTILQQLLINRMKDDGDPTHASAARAGGKPVKNITPAKKK